MGKKKNIIKDEKKSQPIDKQFEFLEKVNVLNGILILPEKKIRPVVLAVFLNEKSFSENDSEHGHSVPFFQ